MNDAFNSRESFLEILDESEDTLLVCYITTPGVYRSSHCRTLIDDFLEVCAQIGISRDQDDVASTALNHHPGQRSADATSSSDDQICSTAL
jgi:hypothetical protein